MGGEGGGMSVNIWIPSPVLCKKDGTPMCFPLDLGRGHTSTVEDVDVERAKAHTMGGAISVAAKAILRRVHTSTSRALFGGSVGIHEFASATMEDKRTMLAVRVAANPHAAAISCPLPSIQPVLETETLFSIKAAPSSAEMLDKSLGNEK